MGFPDSEDSGPKDPELALAERLVAALADIDRWSRGLAGNETWSEIVSTLALLNAGQNVGDVVVPIKRFEAETPMEFDWLWMLGFRRLHDRWCLCLGSGPEDCVGEYWEHPWGWKPIEECALSERTEAALGLPKLLDAMATQAENSEVSQALGSLNQALANLRRVLEKRGDGGARDGPRTTSS